MALGGYRVSIAPLKVACKHYCVNISGAIEGIASTTPAHRAGAVEVERNTLVDLVYSDKLIDGSPPKQRDAVAVPADQPIPVK